MYHQSLKWFVHVILSVPFLQHPPLHMHHLIKYEWWGKVYVRDAKIYGVYAALWFFAPAVLTVSPFAFGHSYPSIHPQSPNGASSSVVIIMCLHVYLCACVCERVSGRGCMCACECELCVPVTSLYCLPPAYTAGGDIRMSSVKASILYVCVSAYVSHCHPHSSTAHQDW